MSESNREYFGAEYVVARGEGLDLSGGKYVSKIEDVTYWGNVGCRYHQMIQYCLQGADLDDLLEYNDIFPTKEKKERYLGTYYGNELPRAGRPLEIKCKSLFDKQGNSLYKQTI